MIKPCAGDLKAAGNFEVGKKISKHSIVAKLALSLDHCSLHIPVGRVGTGVGPSAARMFALGLGRVKTLGGRSELTEVGDARRFRGFGHVRIAAIRG